MLTITVVVVAVQYFLKFDISKNKLFYNELKSMSFIKISSSVTSVIPSCKKADILRLVYMQKLIINVRIRILTQKHELLHLLILYKK